MFIEPVSTEIVCKISNQDPCAILQDHFKQFYCIVADSRIIPNASFVEVDGKVQRCLSGIPVAYHNAVFGCPEKDWDLCIEEQLRYFDKAKMPFVWFLDEDVSPKFKQKLFDRGFKDDGIFHGMIGFLENNLPRPDVPEKYEFQLVTDERTMDEFNEVLCIAFGIEGAGKEACRQFLWNASKNPINPMYHWVVKKDGKVASTLTSFIDKDVVSFWNGATLAEFRRQGLCTALTHFAIQDAIYKGCRLAVSYLMSNGLSFGIGHRLGGQTQWRFNVFIAPARGKLEPAMEALLSGMML